MAWRLATGRWSVCVSCWRHRSKVCCHPPRISQQKTPLLIPPSARVRALLARMTCLLVPAVACAAPAPAGHKTTGHGRPQPKIRVTRGVRSKVSAARAGMDGGTSAPPPEPAIAPDAVINLELGDPTMYEAFWREVGERAAVAIPGWSGMSYFSNAQSLCWFLDPEFEREVRRVHRLVGNAAVDDGYHLVVGTGATQLFQAAMYALSPAGAQRPVGVVSPAPYYSSYPPQTDLLLSGFYRWAGDANAFDGDGHIELVCSPNNPDGAIREAVLSSESGKAIHDLVYYWPQYTPITGAAAHDIMLFTMSKVTGHAGARLGWALVKDRDVAKKMVYFVDRSTIGVSKDSQLRAAKILAVVSDAYGPDEEDDTRLRLFDFARRRMEERWRALRAAVAATGAFSLPEETAGHCNFSRQTVAAYPAFAWLRCEKDGVEDCAEFLRGHGIVARGGEQFGGDARCVRVNMLDRDGVFDVLIDRLFSIT
ncbi:tryptophan aminotransferase-related protein 1-like isoform X1 [Triticum dicoccoides]|uniref:tryptophan aminotransferase-related protein 1-like isoform X1 n=1 Tax=Triticum dicoccoides TaxID=85692 RepID=UPI00188EB70F|nr:tryptophan aminotransferase-related protein 1-like isoform X1 [Triticum dicoccoides]